MPFVNSWAADFWGLLAKCPLKSVTWTAGKLSPSLEFRLLCGGGSLVSFTYTLQVCRQVFGGNSDLLHNSEDWFFAQLCYSNCYLHIVFFGVKCYLWHCHHHCHPWQMLTFCKLFDGTFGKKTTVRDFIYIFIYCKVGINIPA